MSRVGSTAFVHRNPSSVGSANQNRSSALPVELWSHVSLFLDAKSTRRLGSTASTMRRAVNQLDNSQIKVINSSYDSIDDQLELFRADNGSVRLKRAKRFIVTQEDLYETMFGDGLYEHLYSAFTSKKEATEQANALNDSADNKNYYRYRVFEVKTVGNRIVNWGQLPLQHDRTISVQQINDKLKGIKRGYFD